jgi:hypothetical protein
MNALRISCFALASIVACSCGERNHPGDGGSFDSLVLPDIPFPDFTFPGEMFPDQHVKPDLAVCYEGMPCRVGVGKCAKGNARCREGGTGLCIALFQPEQEICNGDTEEFDEDCDGAEDSVDNDAHKSCGEGMYCAGSACAKGCWQNVHCPPLGGNKCVKGVCMCGSSQACSQPNPVCDKYTGCLCDGNSVCGSNETCKKGVCWCGAKEGGEAGPFCVTGTCGPTTGACM